MMNILKESDNKIVGHPISFIDIDETTMHTFAKVNVMKDGKIVKSLDNQEFNTHELGDGETYNFDNFRDAKFFNKTSQPIEKTINRIKNIIQSIKDNKKQEKVIFLTARADFDDKEVFLDTFRNFGIDVDIPNVYIERSGNLTNIKRVADRKKYVILKYLKAGLYTNVKMYDDDIKNLQTFKELGMEINDGKYGIIDSIKKNFPKINKINFYPLLVTNSGKIKFYESKESNEEILIEAIDAYHGSHKNFNQFDTKFVGTGEKCQAHGWGLYFALNPETSKQYHQRISGYHNTEKRNGTDISITYNGKRYDPKSVQGIMIKKMYKDGKENTMRFLKNLSKESKFSKNPEQFKENIRKLYNMVNNIDPNKFKESITVNRGQFYTVKIPDLNLYLDEQKRIKNQSSEVVQKCKEIMDKLNRPFKAKDLSGRDFYNKLKYYSLETGDQLKSYDANKPQKISEFLYDNGIPGIKYDGRTDGDCVVVFNNNDVKIVKKDIDYDNEEQGFEMSELTKYIDDPKKLKGKRVSKEIIDWFIENRPELISDTIIRDKLTLSQKLKLLLFKGDISELIKYEDEVFKNVELNKESEDISLIRLSIVVLSMMRNYSPYDKDYIIKLIKDIPLDIKRNYIQKCGDKCLDPLYYTSDVIANESDKIDIVNEFFKGITIEDVKDIFNANPNTYKLNTGTTFDKGYISYKKYIDVLKYLVCMNQLKRDWIDSDMIYFDDIAIKCLNENREIVYKSIYIDDSLQIDENVLPQFIELLKYDTKGFYAITNRMYNGDKKEDYIKYINKLYTDDVVKSFNQVNDMAKVPNVIKDFVKTNPVKLKNLNNELFAGILRYYQTTKDNVFDINVLKELGEEKTKIVFEYALEGLMSDYYESQNNGYNQITKMISYGILNNKKYILKIAKVEPELLLNYKNIDPMIQKEICSKNPYMIRYIKNPDKNLVNELRTKISNVDDYLEYGD